MQGYKEVTMTLVKEEETTKEWRKTMEETLHKGITYLCKICHFNKMQDMELLEQVDNLKLQHKSMQ